MKNTAIVTGASSGIGREISRVLVEMGYEVYGFGREFPEEELNKPLSDLYLMGYDLQRNAFFARKETSNTDEEE